MYILGISFFHGDCSAALMKDGKLVACAEEERFTRVKHWAGFPSNAIQFCLDYGGIKITDLNIIAIGKDPDANMKAKLGYVIKSPRVWATLPSHLKRKKRTDQIHTLFTKYFDIAEEEVKQKIHYVEHHLAHIASSYLVSGFEDAAVLSIDGFGDFVSVKLASCHGGKIEILSNTYYPHSLGIFYSALTQFLGHMNYGDEYKVMGLSSYGQSAYKNQLSKVVSYQHPGQVRLNLSYFTHHIKNVELIAEDGTPITKKLYTDNLIELLGPERKKCDKITQRHMDIAVSAQAVTEDIYFSLLNHLASITDTNNLCLTGGVSMNSVANGKVYENTPFKNIYIPPAAGDAGTSVGAAFYVYNCILDNPIKFTMDSAYWGPEYDEKYFKQTIEHYNADLRQHAIEKFENEDLLCSKTAEFIANGKVVGWFQGRMEFGARALGARSILADPRNPKMQDILNARIKLRESFRPFAPSILADEVERYFEMGHGDSFMTKVLKIKKDKRLSIPAVTHVDGTGRLQTVDKQTSPLYWKLINNFKEITSVPILLNTSFNENEPIVCKPQQAIDCFLRTNMDVLVLGNFIIERK